MDKIYNFSAGPSMLPIEVLHLAQREFCNWNNMGISIIEVSHRSNMFIEIVEQTEQNLRELLEIPNDYKVIFCHGGARGQFAAVPLNLFQNNEIVDYIISGYWSKIAAQEASKYCVVNEIDIRFKKSNSLKIAMLPMEQWPLSNEAKYLHYCPNETVEGVAIYDLPNFPSSKIVIADYSSAILSKPIDIKQFGVIYASSQKNIGPAGITLVIIQEDLLGNARKITPSMLNYTILAHNNSMYNTPSTFAWYLSNMVLEWLKSQGGLQEMEKRNHKKANILYNAIDNSQFYINQIHPINRSLMNVPFRIKKSHLNYKFVKLAQQHGLIFLKGHKSLGGMRASIYNAMPLIGVQKLVNFMMNFAEHNK